jgi:hypothetical protein
MCSVFLGHPQCSLQEVSLDGMRREQGNITETGEGKHTLVTL